MTTSATAFETNQKQPLESRWLPFATRATFLRAAIVAVIIGSILTLVNQPGWVVGRDSLQLLPLILVFLTPFAVVTVSQVAGARRAYADFIQRRAPASPEGFMATVVSHGIPARAVTIGLIFGSFNAITVIASALLHSGDFASVSVVPLGQAYALPLLFGLLSQAISYRRSFSRAAETNEYMRHHNHNHGEDVLDKGSQLRLAHSATWHCLLGCGIGEVVGVIIGTALNFSNINTLILAVVLGFVFGFVFGMRPLLRVGFNFSRALRQVFVAESLSIVVMEATEVLVQIYTPGVMEAGLGSWIFWLGMGFALVAGYIAAFPVNYALIGKGVRHVH